MTRRLLIVAVAMSSATTAADPPPTAGDEQRRRAAAAFQAAERAFSDEDYPEALQQFRVAFQAAPDDAVRFNLAVCLERLGRFREAGIEYEAAAASRALAPEVRARARGEAERMRARLGRLVLAGRPTGASVRVDGVALCSLPCDVDVDPGRREVVAQTAEATDRQIVDVVRGATSAIALDATIPPPRKRGPSALTWAGGVVAVLGAGAALYFGLRARALHDDYIAMPTAATRDDGLRAKDLANVSIAVAATAAIAVAIDLLVLARRPDAASPRVRASRSAGRAVLLELAF